MVGQGQHVPVLSQFRAVPPGYRPDNLWKNQDANPLAIPFARVYQVSMRGLVPSVANGPTLGLPLRWQLGRTVMPNRGGRFAQNDLSDAGHALHRAPDIGLPTSRTREDEKQLKADKQALKNDQNATKATKNEDRQDIAQDQVKTDQAKRKEDKQIKKDEKAIDKKADAHKAEAHNSDPVPSTNPTTPTQQ